MKHLLLTTIAACACFAEYSAAQPMPNIVLINADDLGYGDLGCYGATHVRTPNIDRLAREGRRFTDFWGPTPTNQRLTIDVTHLTLASLLKDAGYVTSCIGKWHLGFGEKEPNWNGELKPGPLEVGFEYYFGIPSVNSGPPFVYVQNHRVVGADPSDPLVYGQTSIKLYIDELIGTTLKDKAVSWLKQRSGQKPFFLYLATTNIHHPFTPAKQFVGTSECGLYGDFIHELDWIVGEILITLDELKVADNTLVIFTSDNGGMLHVTGQRAWRAGHRMNGDLLGFKFGAWEGGHRVPMIARWPGKIPANTTSDCLLSQIDLAATLASVVGHPLKEGEAPDSMNQLANFIGSPKLPIRKTLIISPNSPEHLTVRHEQWVYIPRQDSGGFQGKNVGDHLLAGAASLKFTGNSNSDVVGGKLRTGAPPAQLYDLEKDSFQVSNVYSKHPEVVRELESILQRYKSIIPSININQ